MRNATGDRMKLSAYKALLAECPHTAMIVDLTERFPRGPKAALRPKDYTVTEREYGWNDRIERTVHDDAFVGGENGYTLEQLHALTKKSWWSSSLENLKTRVKDAALGREIRKPNEDYEYVPTGEHRLFKSGPQTTRRLRTLENRLRRVVKIVEHKSEHNLYSVHVGRCSKPVYMFADNEETARMQYELLLSTAFNSAADRKGIDRGYSYNDDTVEQRYHFSGPSQGVHEIMEHNEKFTTSLRNQNAARLAKIEELKTAIIAADELVQMVEMFTINSCAQATGEE